MNEGDDGLFTVTADAMDQVYVTLALETITETKTNTMRALMVKCMYEGSMDTLNLAL